jgi:phytoene dehydrogenase-like protein
MAKHYDVVVLGAGIGALTTAALLSRRSWRVLVIGQGWRPATYQFEGATLARRTFTFLAGSSPLWSRVLFELAQTQSFRRKVISVDPMFQILAPQLRLDFAPDVQLFGKEIDRTFPEVRRVVDDLYAELARTNAAADAVFERDAVWPPGTFWERREAERLGGAIPRFDAGEWPPLLAEFPRAHDYRTIVTVPATFASRSVDPPEFALARLHGAWTRGVVGLHAGEKDLVDFLVERVDGQGGHTRLTDRVASIAHRRGRVSGVVIDGEDEETGVGFVVTDMGTRALLDLAIEFDPPRRALIALPQLARAESGFVLSIVVRTEGLPALLAEESFLLPTWPERGGGPASLVVHLQRRREPCGIDGATLLVAEAMIVDGERPELEEAREAVLATLEQLLPFIEKHYLVIDSPHDGRPLWDFRSGERKEVRRAAVRATGGSIDPEPMAARWRVDPPSFHGLAGEPIRTPLAGALAVGPATLPALGQEGELLAALSAARLVTRTDRRRERMRREMWNKIELG